jgi:DNA polymerase elongation subunit (family B)
LKPPAILSNSRRRILDFDIECVAAGFADPNWVPVTVTAYAYSWVDEDDITVDALPVRHFYNARMRARFLRPLWDALNEADVLTGHNILRFDLPVLDGEALKLGLPRLPRKQVQDTISLRRIRAKKGQDVLAHVFGVVDEKLPLNWAQWEAAYGEKTLATVKDRVAGDVRQHKALRLAMLEHGWLPATTSR